MTGSCYTPLKMPPVFWVDYSEIQDYLVSGIHDPQELFFAKDFLPGDRIYSDIQTQFLEAIRYSSLRKLCVIDSTTKGLEYVLRTLVKKVASTGNMVPIGFQQIQTNMDAIGIETFLVPEYL